MENSSKTYLSEKCTCIIIQLLIQCINPAISDDKQEHYPSSKNVITSLIYLIDMLYISLVC